MGDYVAWGPFAEDKKWYDDPGARMALQKAGYTREQIEQIEEIVTQNMFDTGSDE